MLQLLRSRSFSALTISQFLGAFNDNAFKQLVLLLALSSSLPWIASSPWIASYGQALGSAVFALPFVLFSPLTGQLADRFGKRRIILWANAAEIGVMVLGGVAFLSMRFEAVLVVLLLMGLQSTLFGPAKYGSIPEIVEAKDLSRANALIQMTTFVAIVLGTALGAQLLGAHLDRLLIPAAIFVCFATAGFLASLFMRPLPAADPVRRICFNPVRELVRQYSLVRGDRPLVLAVFGSCLFYVIGAALMLAITSYNEWLDLSAGQVGLLLTLLSLGIAAGSILAGRLSGDRIESGLIPAGLLGMAVAISAVLLAPNSVAWLRVCLVLAGLAAGLFTVPIRALIQHRPSPETKGAVLGFSEVMDFVGVFLASGLYALLNGVLGLDPPTILATLGALTLALTVGSFFYTAEFALRFWLILMIRTLYRIRATGTERIPKSGGAILVCNHLSYVDPFLVSAAIGRPVRFMMYRDFYAVPGIGLFSRLMGAIPVSSEDSLGEKRASMERAAELLRAGELVCIFAEGSISRSGGLMGFRRGLERIARASGAPIVPLALDGVWGSVFSFVGGRFFWKLPRRIPYPVDLSIGEALPAHTRAWQVRLAVQELLSDSRARLTGPRDTLTDAFLRAAKHHSRRLALVDSTGARVTYRKLLISALALRSAVRRGFPGEERIGVYLPPSVGAAALDLAITLAGKVSINLNYSLGADSLAEPIERAGLKHVITSPRFLKALGAPPPLEGDGTVMLESLAAGLTRGEKLCAALLALLPAPLLTRLVRPVSGPDRVATILFSSGSTGVPKGVVLTHGNVLANTRAMVQALHLVPDSRILGVLPFFHSFGFTTTLWVPLLYGAAAVYHNRPTDAQTIGELCAAERVTIALATPTFIQSWMRRIAPEQLASLRVAIVGAEKLSPRLATAFEEKYGLPLFEGYGCTELSPVVSVNLPDLSEVPEHESANRRGSVGRPIVGVTVRILDPESGQEMPLGEEGAVVVRGPNVMRGYLDDPERTAAVLRDGWYDTGDVGRLDRDGFLTLTDRRSRFSKIGGEMVPQGRVEEVLGELAEVICRERGLHPTDGALPRLAVTAVPDERKGERLVVLHTALPFEREELQERLKRSELPPIYLPRTDQYFEVDRLPELGSGKADLSALKAMARELAGR